MSHVVSFPSHALLSRHLFKYLKPCNFAFVGHIHLVTWDETDNHVNLIASWNQLTILAFRDGGMCGSHHDRTVSQFVVSCLQFVDHEFGAERERDLLGERHESKKNEDNKVPRLGRFCVKNIAGSDGAQVHHAFC